MTSSGGDWVAVPIPGAPDRWDWVPAEQPPSPDGGPGRWHVTGGSGEGAGKWEWFPSSAPTPPAFPPAPAFGDQATEPVSRAAAEEKAWETTTPMPAETKFPWETEAPAAADAPMPWETAVSMPWEKLPPAVDAPASAPAGFPPAAPASEVPSSLGANPWHAGSGGPVPPPAPGAPGWHAAPPVAVGRPKRSLKIPLIVLAVVVLLGGGAAIALVALSGGDDGKNKTAITELVDYVVTVDSGKDVCSSHLTSDFVQNVFGSIDACEKDDDESDDESGDATGADVTDIKLEKDTATATVTVLGGDTAGATGTWAFAKDDKDVWRVSEWRADYLRSSFKKGFGENYKSDGSDDPFGDSDLRGCVTDQALKLDDPGFLNFAHQQFRDSDDATKQMLEFMGECPSDTDGVSALRALFEKGFRASISTQLPPEVTDCIVNGLRTSLSDEDIQELSVNSDQPHPDIQARIQQTTLGCAQQAGATPPSDGSTPDFSSPDLDDPGFGI